MTTPPVPPPTPVPPPYGVPGGEPSPDLPHYGCSLPVAVRRFWKKYATFAGRASRAEYWWWVLAQAIVVLVLTLLTVVAALPGSTTAPDGTSEPGPGIAVGFLVLAFGLAALVPNIAVTVRRLHDANLSGWFYLLTLIPYVGGLVLVVLTVLPPKPEGTRFDPYH